MNHSHPKNSPTIERPQASGRFWHHFWLKISKYGRSLLQGELLREFYKDHIDPDGIQPLQALRTTIAGILAIIIYRALNWPQSYWVLLSTVLILQTYIGNTPKQRLTFLIWTSIFSAIATYLASRLCQQPIALAFFLMFSTFICLYANAISSNVGNVAYYINLFCLSAGALPVDATDAWQRTACVIFGGIVAVSVCLCCWPESMAKQIQQVITQNLYRLCEFNRVLTERKTNEHAITIRRNRLLRGLQLARLRIGQDEIQALQIIQKIEYLYEIMINFHQLKHFISEQQILRLINREIMIISRRMTWVLRGITRGIRHRHTLPDITKFNHALLTFEKIYHAHVSKLNQEQFLAFTVYIDNVHKLEKTMTDLVDILENRFQMT